MTHINAATANRVKNGSPGAGFPPAPKIQPWPLDRLAVA
jgi:hypothetical protein